MTRVYSPRRQSMPTGSGVLRGGGRRAPPLFKYVIVFVCNLLHYCMTKSPPIDLHLCEVLDTPLTTGHTSVTRKLHAVQLPAGKSNYLYLIRKIIKRDSLWSLREPTEYEIYRKVTQRTCPSRASCSQLTPPLEGEIVIVVCVANALLPFL